MSPVYVTAIHLKREEKNIFLKKLLDSPLNLMFNHPAFLRFFSELCEKLKSPIV